MESIGRRIKQKRIERDLTQEQLALLCGWEAAKSRIANYEAGRRMPKFSDLGKLAKALKVSPRWLAFGD